MSGKIAQIIRKNSLLKILTFHSNRGLARTLAQKLERAKGESSSRGSNTDKVNCSIRIAIVINPALIAVTLELKKLAKKPM